MKKCPRCSLSKPSSDFHVAPARADGLGAYCIPCARLKQVKWREENRQRHRDSSRAYRKTERGKVLLSANRRKHVATVKAGIKRWKASNPEALRDYFHRRKAAIKAVGGNHTREQIAKLLIEQGGRCKVCAIDITKRRDRDHIVPISAGGSNDISNIQLLCPPCNYAKRAKSMEQFLRERGNGSIQQG